MNRDWHSFFGRALCVLGLLLFAQISHAAQQCVSVHASEDCLEASSQLCAAQAPCLGVGTPAASPSYDPPPSADAPRHAAVNAVPSLQQGAHSGLAPGSHSPVHILFRRYLS